MPTPDEQHAIYQQGFKAGQDHNSKMSKETKQEFKKLKRGIYLRGGLPIGIFGILAIVIIECYAISKGIDGKVLIISMIMISGITAGIAGYKIGFSKDSIKKFLS